LAKECTTWQEYKQARKLRSTICTACGRNGHWARDCPKLIPDERSHLPPEQRWPVSTRDNNVKENNHKQGN
jgi:hypothetical protein